MTTLLSPDLARYFDTVWNIQKQNPDIDCFTQIHVTGHGWRFIHLKSGKEYTPDTYFQEFGVYPDLPHPETLSGDGTITGRLEETPPKAQTAPTVQKRRKNFWDL